MQNKLDAVRTLAVNSGHKLEGEWLDLSAGDTVGDLERVQEDSEEPGDDVEVDDLEGSAGVGVVNLGDDPTFLVAVADKVSGCMKSWRLQDPVHY